jgi:hypothetical protein
MLSILRLFSRLMAAAPPTGGGGAPAAAMPVPMATGGSNGAVTSAAGGLPILTPQYLQTHRVGIPNQKDVIWNPIYDSNIYPSSGVTNASFSFFVNPQGSAVTSVSPGAYYGGTGKTVYDTNFQGTNGSFTIGNEFYVIGSETDLIPGYPTTTTTFSWGYYPGSGPTSSNGGMDFLNDVWVLSTIGFKQFKVATDRAYIQDGPLGKFPSKTRLYVAAALAGAATTTAATPTAFAASYAVFSGHPYIIVPVYLASNQLFSLTYSFAGAIALPSGFPALVRERLNGYLIRIAT